ncbi:ABC transporter ATP-binding protein [Helicobacter cinaedi]|uniref:ABC transporter ATP-binding protein n=1 Tax=Helicobacter cinaedi TaxID=213 RepID=UPI000DA1741F|nr:ABC transporter ATP-binding protein [Helicobacter cinaedi]
MSATQNFQSDLFKGQFSGFQGYMEARTEYGTLISLDRLKNGKFIVTEYEKGEEDYSVVFDTFAEVHIAFRHWVINISSEIELKEDGSIGHYPRPKTEEVQTGATLFDFFGI